MRLLNLFKIATSAIKRNKFRSFLTMLGIVIGVGSVITMLAIGQGSNQSIKDNISSMGTNLIFVMPSSMQSGGVSQGRESSQTLTEKDLTYLKNNATLIDAVSPEISSSGQVIFGSNNWPTTLRGGSEDYLYIKKYEIATGRNYTAEEIKSASKVCIIGQTVVDNVFGEDVDPIGKIIRFGSIPFKVIGTLTVKGNNSFGQDQDDIVLAPYSTIMKRITRQTYFRSIVMSATDEDMITPASEELAEMLRISHKLKDTEEDDFEIRTQEELVNTMGSVSELLLVLLGSISAISLLVGGIGIMNIMYVSVTERTREIGLRLAIGGKGKDILMQFLIEALLLSVLGGLIGVLLGYVASYFVEAVLKWPVVITNSSVILSFAVCSFIGVFFGWYPARKASALDPIVALRHE